MGKPVSVRVSVKMPIWFDVDIIVDEDDIVDGQLIDGVAECIIDNFDFSDATESIDYSIQNASMIQIFDEDNNTIFEDNIERDFYTKLN